MINGLEGIPGSGKSYEASVYHVLEALKDGRKVITNMPVEKAAYTAIDPAFGPLLEVRYVPAPVRGTWNPERVDPETGDGQAFVLFEDGHIEAAPESIRVFGHVWDFYSEWRHPVSKRGPLYVVDECHVAMPKLGTANELVQWFKLHRHFGADVLLCTQKFRQMNQDIAELMGMVIKVRKADVLGKPDHYIRKVHAGYRGEPIDTSERQYRPGMFQLYRSHTQGVAVLEAGATDVAPQMVKLRRWQRGLWTATAIAIGFACWVIFFKDSTPAKGGKKGAAAAVVDAGQAEREKHAQAMLGGPVRVDRVTVGEVPAPDAEKPAEPASGYPEPFAGKTLHLTGAITRPDGGWRHIFVMAAQGVSVVQLTQDDLTAAGYTWEARGQCIGYLGWEGKRRAVVCDAPARGSGSDERPLVLKDGYGSDGRTPIGAAGSHAPQGAAPIIISDHSR